MQTINHVKLNYISQHMKNRLGHAYDEEVR